MTRLLFLNSSYAGSYGLHPLLYCYSNRGNFRPASFYATLEFVKAINSTPLLLTNFINKRGEFEDFIFNNDYIVQRIIDTYRRGIQSAKHISEYYFEILRLLNDGKSRDEIFIDLAKNEKYGRFIPASSNEVGFSTAEFSRTSKSEVFIRKAYSSAPRCSICGGLLHGHSLSIDHILRK